MEQQIKRKLPNCTTNKCLKSSVRSIFGISDTTAGIVSIEKTNYANAHFLIKNVTRKKINVLAIDSCLLNSSDPSKCDFAVFDNKTFCFVEIKEASTKKGRRKHKVKAVSQLYSSIKYFITRLNFKNYQIEAILCLAYPPRRPVVSTAMQSNKALFANMGVILSEGTEKEFL